MCVCVRARACVCVCVSLRVFVYVYVCLCLCVCACLCLCLCLRVCACPSSCSWDCYPVLNIFGETFTLSKVRSESTYWFTNVQIHVCVVKSDASVH